MSATRDAEPENWQARLGAVVRHLDEAIETGRKESALRAVEIANQLIAESVILEAKAPPDDDAPSCPCQQPADNDQGVCMHCGRWINYRERSQP